MKFIEYVNLREGMDNKLMQFINRVTQGGKVPLDAISPKDKEFLDKLRKDSAATRAAGLGGNYGVSKMVKA